MTRYFAFLLALASAACTSGLEHGQLPMIVAERTSFCGSSWSLSVTPSGHAAYRQWDTCFEKPDRIRHFRLTEPEMRVLQDAIATAEFMALPSVIAPATIATDEDSLRITIWERGQEKLVTAEGLDRAREPQHAARFLLMWSALLEAASQIYH